MSSVDDFYQRLIESNGGFSGHCPRCRTQNWRNRHGRTNDGGFKFIHTCNSCGMKYIFEVNGRGYTEEKSFFDENGKCWGVP